MKDYTAFSFTSIGYSHITAKKVCQDSSSWYQDEIASIIVVSDGHGSANFTRSDRGSRFACDAALNAAIAFLKDVILEDLLDEGRRDEVVLQLCKNIMLRWNTMVDRDVACDPFSKSEVENVSEKYREGYLRGISTEHAYGATLIIAIITRDFVLAIRNGDGQCVAVDRDGRFSTPIPWNEDCEFNITTSLCDSEAIDEFRYWFATDLPAAIFIGSDGVDDSYATVDDLYNLYRRICLKALDEGPDAAAEFVKDALPEITKRGSTDDVSIAGLINTKELAQAQDALEIAQNIREIQLEDARREQKKRILLRDLKVAQKQQNKAIQELKETQSLKSIIMQSGRRAIGKNQIQSSLVQTILQLEYQIDQLSAELEELGGVFERETSMDPIAIAIIRAETNQQIQSDLPLSEDTKKLTEIESQPDIVQDSEETADSAQSPVCGFLDEETFPGDTPLQSPIDLAIIREDAVPLVQEQAPDDVQGNGSAVE